MIPSHPHQSARENSLIPFTPFRFGNAQLATVSVRQSVMCGSERITALALLAKESLDMAISPKSTMRSMLL